MKIKRQAKIIELIKSKAVETQEELTELLDGAGFNVTQATVSRDIRELRLTKVTADDGLRQKYAPQPSDGRKTNQLSGRVLRVFRDGVMSIDYAQNLIIIKTPEGMAMAVAACIDSLNSLDMLGTEILGTIAGDDCIFCAVKSEEKAVAAIGRIREILNA
jgi:transcriptional regulator of arginine metabolism